MIEPLHYIGYNDVLQTTFGRIQYKKSLLTNTLQSRTTEHSLLSSAVHIIIRKTAPRPPSRKKKTRISMFRVEFVEYFEVTFSWSR